MDQHQLRRGSTIGTSKEAQSNLVSCVLTRNWYETYLGLLKGTLAWDPNGLFHLDILKDLCEDQIPDQVVLHLLSLLEENVGMFKEENLEQTVGSLINIFSSTSKPPEIKRKYLFTSSVLFLCNLDLVQNSPSLKELFDDFLKMLLNFAQKSDCNNVIALSASECLRTFEDTCPGILSSHYNSNRINKSCILLMTTIAGNGLDLKEQDMKYLIATLPSLSTLSLQQNLNNLFSCIVSKKGDNSMSPLIFKQFFGAFTLSTEVYHLHFLLLLLRTFGLELFSSIEEENLINQLVILSTHPSLAIANRLLVLDFIKSLVPVLKHTRSLDSTFFEILPVDGPDTQEKKLSILSETDLNDQELIMALKSLENMSLTLGNHRATNSMYRTLHCFLSKRPSIQRNVENLLISMIIASPQQHVSHSLALMTINPALAPNVCKSLLKKLLHMEEVIAIEQDLRAYLLASQWMLKRKGIFEDDEELRNLLTLLFKKCQEFPKLIDHLLACCAATIRFQSINEPNKQILNQILTFVGKESRPPDLAISSWAQIYSIAINTLTKQENLSKVFVDDCDIDDCTEELVIECNSATVPIQVQRIPFRAEAVSPKDSAFALTLKLKISIRSDAPIALQSLFAVVINMVAPDQQLVHEIDIPYLVAGKPHEVTLQLWPEEAVPFGVVFRCQFSDKNGSTHHCDNLSVEQITFRDLLLPIESEESFNELWDLLSKKTNSIGSVICMKEMPSLAEFKESFPWIDCFRKEREDQLAFAVLPNSSLLISLEVVNNLLNVNLLTDCYKALELLFLEFRGNVDTD